jgi:protein-L-isoaspartate(D-aspartate) O-methyltransferase
MLLNVLRLAGLLIIMLPAAHSGGCPTKPAAQDQNEKQQSPPPEEEHYRRLRDRMVREQLQGRDVQDSRVLDAMRKVPRHRFVIPEQLDSAYDDGALPLMLGQTISQPYIVGYMTQALKLKGHERVLEIGTGSGYQAAVLAELVAEVYTLEILPDLARRAQAILDQLGYRNIHIRTGDGYQGWPEFAPFDCVIVTAAPERVPQPLIDQLKEDGRMIIPLGRFEQELVLIEKGETGIRRQVMIPVRFVPMTGAAQQRPPE